MMSEDEEYLRDRLFHMDYQVMSLREKNEKLHAQIRSLEDSIERLYEQGSAFKFPNSLPVCSEMTKWCRENAKSSFVFFEEDDITTFVILNEDAAVHFKLRWSNYFHD